MNIVRPNFLIIGAMKSGTTTLYHHLRVHPQVFMPANKEPQFFSDEPMWTRGFGWYESLFAQAGDAVAIGEASTDYTKYPLYPHVPERIFHYAPDMKLIYILRAPVQRMYSHYVHNYYAGRVDGSPAQVLLNDPHYLAVSCYYLQIQQYLAFFPSDQLKLIVLDDLKHNPRQVMRDVFGFLGVDIEFEPPNVAEKRHVTAHKAGRDNALMQALKRSSFYNGVSARLPLGVKVALNKWLRKPVASPPSMTPELFEQLADRLWDDVIELSKLLGRDLSFWLMNK